ncbi:hypothetical protein Efla_005415 [Eimeria flavescens]
MSHSSPALPALAAYLASAGPTLIPGGDLASPETPKEAASSQQLQQQKGGGAVLKEDASSESAAKPDNNASTRLADASSKQALAPSGDSLGAACKHEEEGGAAEAEGAAQQKAAVADTASQPEFVGEAATCPSCPAAVSEEPGEQQQLQEAQRAEEQQEAGADLVGAAELPCEASSQVDAAEPAPPPASSAAAEELGASAAAVQPAAAAAGAGGGGGSPASPPRRGTDRSGEWHPLDAVVERIESHVRPGSGGQRLQWSKGFRMPLGADGRQILLRRLRKAYHANPVRCSEEYGSDAAGGATHRKRRPARSAAAAAAAAASQQQHAAAAAAGEGGGVAAAEGAAGRVEEGGAGGASPLGSGGRGATQSKRKRRSPSFVEAAEASQLQSARPKRSRRFSPAYLRDYEMLAETFRLPPPPSRKAAASGQLASSAAAASRESILSWSCSNEELAQLHASDDLFAAALRGRESASVQEAVFGAAAREQAAAQAAAAAAAAAASVGPASFSSEGAPKAFHRSGSMDLREAAWSWGTQQSASPELGGQLPLPDSSLHAALLAGSAEGEIRDVNLLLQQEGLSGNQALQREAADSDCKGRFFFSAELPGDAYDDFAGGPEGAKQQRLRCSGGTRTSSNGGSVVQQRRQRRGKAAAAGREGLLLASPASAPLAQPSSLAEALVGAEGVKHEVHVAAAAGAAPGEHPAGSQANLHLLTTNYTIAAQYLQVLELLAVQRQILELTQSLSSRNGGAEGSAPAAAGAAPAAIFGAAGRADGGSSLNSQSPKLDPQSLLSQQLILQLGLEAGLSAAAQQQPAQSQQQAVVSPAPLAAASHRSLLSDLERKVSALEALATGRSAATGAQSEAAAKSSAAKQSGAAGMEAKCKRELSRQSALSCSTPGSPVDGYESASASASPCGSGSGSSACNTPDSLGSDRLLLFSSLWHPLPPAEGLAAGTL